MALDEGRSRHHANCSRPTNASLYSRADLQGCRRRIAIAVNVVGNDSNVPVRVPIDAPTVTSFLPAAVW